MSDKELLELAAKAAGIPVVACTCSNPKFPLAHDTAKSGKYGHWNPLAIDGDALRLAVQLRLSIVHEKEYFAHHEIPTIEVMGEPDEKGSRHCEMHSLDDDPCAATRRAIVKAAADIGRAKP